MSDAESLSDVPSLVSNGNYAPSPNTSSQAVQRASQMRIQTLLRRLLVGQEEEGPEGLSGGELNARRIGILRFLRKSLRECNFQLGWLAQVDFLETIERILRDEESSADGRLVHDCTQLLIEALPKFVHEIDLQTLEQILPNVIENLGHERSEVRRASLLLLNQLLNERQPNRFRQFLRLFIDHGLANHRNQQARRGAVLSLPLLMTEQVVEGEDLLPLVRCLGKLLVESPEQLFYSLYLALQRLHLMLGDDHFGALLRQCEPEAALLYRQAASRNNSLASFQPAAGPEPTLAKRSFQRQRAQRREPPDDDDGGDDDDVDEDEEGTRTESLAGHSMEQKQVTFENDHQVASSSQSHEGDSSNNNNKPASESRRQSRLSSSSSCPSTGASPGEQLQSSDRKSQEEQLKRRLSSVSSTCSSDAHLVDPAHYMSQTALHGRPLANYDQIHHVDHSNVASLAINDLGPVCNTPTMELGAGQSELRFGIFPRHLVGAALAGRYSDRLEAMQEMMCIVRESPVNHLAILMTYFDSFLEQFLGQLMQQGADYKLELIAIDMIETIVIKTKVSTMQFVRPMVGLLVRTLADSRSIFRDSTTRVLHKMMAFLPPQHVIDAIFEHKHNKWPLVREESINRVTAAVLEYDKNEFNLTKLCYHILPMLADHHSSVRLAALECIAALAHALGPERIGSLLTAAEAVQTGCDYDGLLDAINVRLQRHTLPRSNSDGSIRYVIKPFLSQAGQHREHLASDVRWVLEAPSSHQHSSGPYYVPHQHPHQHPQHHQHQPHTEVSPGHAHHRLGVYSPPDPTRRRRSSLGLVQLTGLGPEDERRHAHHHPGHARQQQPEVSELPAKTQIGAGRPADDERSAARRSSRRRASSSGGATDKAKNISERDRADGERPANPEPSREAGEPSARETGGSRRPSGQQRRQSIKGRRSNSQDSLSSTDTNKVLFQYYLGKFKQSLAESNDGQAVLPSDSIIYTDVGQAYELSRHRSRHQQTSLDYEPDLVGRVPNPSSVGPSSRTTARSSSMSRERSQSSAKMVERQMAFQVADQADEVRSNGDSSEPTSGSESPQTVMEASGSNLTQAGPRHSLQSPTETQALAESNRKSSLPGGPSQGRRQSMARPVHQPSPEGPGEHMVEPEPERRKSLALGQQQQHQQFIGSGDRPPEEQSVSGCRARPSLVRQSASTPMSETSRQGSIATTTTASSATTGESPSSDNQKQFETASGSPVSQEEPRSSSGRRHRERRRSSSRRRRPSAETGERLAPSEVEVEAAQREVRRRASRSQPPERRQLTRSSSKSTHFRQDDDEPRGQDTRQVSSGHQSSTSTLDMRRAVSVSPSLANSVNIRHILENVAQVEGPFTDSHLALKVALDAIESPCWSTKVEGILALIRLVNFHQQVVLSHLHEIVSRTTEETRNLRSTVARAAIFALGEYCARLKRLVEPEMDIIIQALMHKSVENTAFIRDDIRRSLSQLVENLTQWRLATLLIHHGAGHKNVHVRRMASQFVAQLVDRMGAAKCLVGAKDISSQIIPAAAKFAQDSSPHTRYFGRLILAKLIQHGSFERLLRRNLTPALYRSSLGIIESVKRRGPGEPPADI